VRRGDPAAQKTAFQPSFARRAFLISLMGMCIAISVGFVAVHLAVRSELREGIQDCLRRTEYAVEQARSGQNSQTALALQLVSADPSVGAAIPAVASPGRHDPSRQQAVRTLKERLSALRETVGSDWVAANDSRGRLVAAVGDGESAVSRFAGPNVLSVGLTSIGGTLYDIAATPVRVQGGAVGTLTVATRFDLAALAGLGPAGLLHRGRLIRSTFSPATTAEIANRLEPECVRAGCELRTRKESFLVTPVSRAASGDSPGDEYQLLSFRSIDAAADEAIRRFRWLLATIGICMLLLAICISAAASRAVSRPLQKLVARLVLNEACGKLQPSFPENAATREINQLAACFNRAAMAIELSNERLDQAAIEFVESLAQTLDARDPYTAGHSKRVANYSVAIAAAMRLSAADTAMIRVGAQLHDIGKMGIPDAVLQKPGYLTPEEYELVKLHPQIGKRILERVAQFEKYLPIVELHHEDHDGGGYPYGLKGHEVPLAVRIVHVADVYDALTSNRSYRDAMPASRAREILDLCAGTQFDREVVRTFSAILIAQAATESLDLERLAVVVLA
jgi:putative nucleotidyltransferase with HDIG domain